eukprot:307724-Chlamydomonas_euryale.AAC.3
MHGQKNLPGCGWGADGHGRGRGRVALSTTAARRSRDGSRDAGLGPPAGGPRRSGDPSRMKSSAGDCRRAWQGGRYATAPRSD